MKNAFGLAQTMNEAVNYWLDELHEKIRLLRDLVLALVSITNDQLVGNFNRLQEQTLVHINAAVFDNHDYGLGEFNDVVLIQVLVFK